MMKKIICLALGLLMILAVMTSCGNNQDAVQDILDDASRNTTTLNMWVITESALVAEVSELLRSGWDPDRLTAEQQSEFDGWDSAKREAMIQVDDIGEAINKITKQKFKTMLNMVYVTADKYYEKLEKAFVDHEKAIEEAKAAAKAEREALKNGETLASETETVEETEINALGIPELKYPEAAEYQVDVFFVGSFEKYREYADNDLMVTLDDKLENTAMQLAYYVNPIFLNAAMYNSVTYAIPNNRPIGEYTYLCIKTSEMEQYGFNTSDFTNYSIYDDKFYQFISEVQANQGTTGVYPIYTNSAEGELPLELIHYWNYDLDTRAGDCLLKPGEFSLFGSVYNNLNQDGLLTTRNDVLTCGNMLSDEIFMKQYLARKLEYEAEFVTTDAEADVAACVITGGWELREQYENAGYQVLMMSNPRAVGEQVYDSMFAIGAHTVDEARSMEIITYLNTNEEFRNLVQHGIENVNYTLSSVTREENGIDVEYYYAVETEGNLYDMDVYKTGNVFLAYPSREEDVFEWEYGKRQNLDATMYPTLGFYLDLESYDLDFKSVRIINAVSAHVKTFLATLTTAEEVIDFYDNRVGRNINDENMAALLLEIIDGDMTYVEGEETKTFTIEELEDALGCMKARIVDEETEGALQSPYALYFNWRTVNGF
ncbi:MAG: hypothetical protein E7585_01465 [Ruminococcaceae bacterium]|nr:hypothetical protein [Oscillospiraceae bacterium]